MPEPLGSLPLQLTVNVVIVCVAGSALTALLGYTESIVLVTMFVLMAALRSKTIEAWLEMGVPFARPLFGLTVKVTKPSPCWEEFSGGRNPASGSAGAAPVTGSIDCIVHVSVAVLGFSEVFTVTGYGLVDTLAWVE